MNLQNFPVFSLFNREIGGDGFAQDCVHHHPAAAIQAILRRSNRHSDSFIQAGKLVIDTGAYQVTLNGQHVHLTRREYSILEALALRKGSTLTKEMIMSHV